MPATLSLQITSSVMTERVQICRCALLATMVRAALQWRSGRADAAAHTTARGYRLT